MQFNEYLFFNQIQTPKFDSKSVSTLKNIRFSIQISSQINERCLKEIQVDYF